MSKDKIYMKRKTWIIVFFIIIVIGLIWYFYRRYQANKAIEAPAAEPKPKTISAATTQTTPGKPVSNIAAGKNAYAKNDGTKLFNAANGATLFTANKGQMIGIITEVFAAPGSVTGNMLRITTPSGSKGIIHESMITV